MSKSVGAIHESPKSPEPPKKKQSRWTSIPNRKKAVTLFNQGRTIQEIMAELDLTYWQVYNVVSGRSKSNYRARSDKGQRRVTLETTKVNENAPTDLTAFENADDFLEYQAIQTMERINTSNLQPADSIKALKDCSVVLRDVHNRRMQSKLKRGDAEIIAKLIRRFLPDATDEQVIDIYAEELKRYEAEAN